MKNFYITKNPMPLIVRMVTIIAASDLLFLLLIILIVSVRNILGIDSAMLFLFVLLFLGKTAVTLFAAYKQLRVWTGVSYYVMDGNLVVQSRVPSIASSTRKLKDLVNIRVTSGSALMGSRDSGNITLEFSSAASKEQVTLFDVDEPKRVIQAFK